MSDADIDALQSSGLDRLSPFSISGVSRTKISIPWYYGAIEFRGRHYIYMPETDELVRDDVVRWMHARWKEQSKVTAEVDNKQSGLFE